MRYLPVKDRKRTKKKSFSVFRLFALLLFGFVILGYFVKISPLLGKSDLDFNSRVTVLLNSSPLVLLSISPSDKLTILSIPDDLYVDAVMGIGRYRASALPELGFKEGNVEKIFCGSVSNLLAVPINGYISLGLDKVKAPEGLSIEKIKKVRNSANILNLVPFVLSNDFNRLESNISKIDLLKFYVKLLSTRAEEISFINLGDQDFVSSIVLADGSTALSLNYDNFINHTDGFFIEQSIKSEGMKIDLYNSTSVKGLASSFGRFVTNMGGDIIGIFSVDTEIEKCRIYGDEIKTKSETALLMEKVLNCELIPSPKEGSRADLSIVVGGDYKKYVYGQGDLVEGE